MRRRVIAALLGALLLGAAGWYLPQFIAFLQMGTAFAAQQTCACVHVSARPLESCLPELGPQARLLEVRVDGATVRARALLGLVVGESLYESPFGCHPVR